MTTQYTKAELLGRMVEWVDEFWSGKDYDYELSSAWAIWSGGGQFPSDDVPMDTKEIRKMAVDPIITIGMNAIDHLRIPFSHRAGILAVTVISCYANPGIMKMYLAAFKHESAATDPQLANIDWVNSVTDQHWYAEKFLHTMWNKQKLPDGTNLVDRVDHRDFPQT